MYRDRIRILECQEGDFENAVRKNQWIAASLQEYLGIVSLSHTNAQELLEIFGDNEFLYDYAAVVFVREGPEGETDLAALLSYPQMEILGYVFRRNMLQESGRFNERLCEATNYEFVCRLAGCEHIFCVPCDSTDSFESSEVKDAKKSAEEIAYTYAYIIRRYWSELQQLQLADKILQGFMQAMHRRGVGSVFRNTLTAFFENSILYNKLVTNTAPFLILFPDDTCYGVLADFAQRLTEELVQNGQAVVATDRGIGRQLTPDGMLQTSWRGIVGFQTFLVEKDWMREVRGNKFQFWLDNPAFFNDMFRRTRENYYLCQDAFYAEHLTKFYGAEHAIQFPPAGTDIGLCEQEERELGVVFVGTYELVSAGETWNETERGFYEYMLEHPRLTFETGLRQYLGWEDGEADRRGFLNLLWSLVPVCQAVIRQNRAQIIETILAAGIQVHVYGDSWKEYQSPCQGNLILHETVSVEESLKVFGHAKIGLNIMTWHKAGMTERIANILLSGAVCVSDETVYLKQYFENDEELVLFSLEHLEELPVKIKRLLEDETLRSRIAAAGYRKAAAEHTWKRRTEQFLELAEAAEQGLI